MNISIGDELDFKYRVIKQLGGGGFGDVYLAVDQLLDRQVAIKLLRDRRPDDQTDLIHEMRSLDQLHHPRVVTFHHHFIEDGFLFLVMEYCAGGSLRNKMRDGPIPSQSILQWGKELAEALQFIHEQGIVHHDIKPDNILFTSENSLKLGDFGVANRNIGTDWYMAPEMLAGWVDNRDVRVDVYALGITLLEVLQNRNPFSGMAPAIMYAVKLRHAFIPSEIEHWIQDILAKATHPTPELRFQSMQEFREAIESKHINYVFDRSRVQAHALAAEAERLLARRQAAAASKRITQALYAAPDCVSALIAAGRYNLFVNEIPQARQYFDKALSINPRTNIQKELGWLSLEVANYSRAISLLTDHLQRNAADYEAYNLLLECFYRTERYEVGMQVAKLMLDEHAPSSCFEANGLLCGFVLHPQKPDPLGRPRSKQHNPFIAHNELMRTEALDRFKTKAIFANYRFGIPGRRANTITIEQKGRGALELNDPVVTIGRFPKNSVCLSDGNVSRYHCAIVNCLDDVWLYDLGSSQRVFVDGKMIDRKAYLEGVHDILLGGTELKICSKLGLLV